MERRESDTKEQLRAAMVAAGLAIDEARLEALAPVYAGLLSGAARIATLDLGETEPAMMFGGEKTNLTPGPSPAKLERGA